MHKRKVVLVTVGLVLLAGLIGTVVAVSAQVSGLPITTQVQASGDATKLEAPPPLLAPPDPVGYERLSSDDAQIVADDGRPIVQFRQAPLEFAESVEVYLPEMKPWEDPELEAYAVLSSVRYSGSGHTILVTTARPSPGALRRAVAPGEQAIQLAGGSAAWLSKDGRCVPQPGPIHPR